LAIRRVGSENFERRDESEWPLARTEWTKLHLDPATNALTYAVPAAESHATYRGFGEGITFALPPLDGELEITGPVVARIWMSSATSDADLFLVLRVFDEHEDEVLLQGAIEPRQPIAQGWLRASHRKIDRERSLPWQPFHPHDAVEPLVPHQVY